MSSLKKNPIVDFVTGGDLVFHRLQLILVNVFRVSLVGVAVFLIVFAGLVHFFMGQYEWYAFKKLFYAHFWKLLFMPGWHLSFVQPDGQFLPRVRADQLIELAQYSPQIATATSKVTWFAGLSFLVGCLLIGGLVIFNLRYGKKAQEDEFVRGQKIVEAEELAEMVKNPSPLKIANVPIPVDLLARNVLTVGSMGTGKSQAINQLIIDARRWGKKMVIYDPTGEYAERYFREGKDVILNPIDARCADWSLLADIRQITDPAMASRFFVPENKKSSDPVWDNAARMLLEDVIRIVHARGGSMADIKRIITQYTLEQLHELLTQYSATSLGIINPKNERGSESVKLTLTSQPALRFFDFFADKAASFSIRDFMRREDDTCLFLTSKPTQHEAIKPFLSVWLELALTEMMSMSPTTDVRVVFFLDELASLAKLNSLENALTQARKYGIVTIVGIQNLAQMEEIYGPELTKVFIANLQNKLMLRTEEESSAKRLADTLGKEDVEEVNESKSFAVESSRDGVSLGTKRTERHLITATEIMILPDLTGYLKLAGSFPIAKVQYQYKKTDTIAEGYVMRDGLDMPNPVKQQDDEIPEMSEAVFHDKQIGNSDSHLY